MSGNTAHARIGVLGGGVMGETLIAGVSRSGRCEVWVAEKNAERAAWLESHYHVRIADVGDVVAAVDLVLIVVKPQDVPGLLAQIAPHASEHTVVVSLAAGVLIDTVEGGLQGAVPVLRVMPNTPALVAQGMFAVSRGHHVTDEQLAAVVSLLSDFGQVVVLEESQQDAVTAVSGSGPAYVFYLAEQMITAGVQSGLDPKVARQLAVQTITGSAALLASSHESPQELRRKVTSPGGTTYAATSTFDEYGVDAGLRAGVLAAAARSAELSAPHGSEQQP